MTDTANKGYTLITVSERPRSDSVPKLIDFMNEVDGHINDLDEAVLERVVLITADTTINVPDDFATVALALASIENAYALPTATVEIVVADGTYTLAEPISGVSGIPQLKVRAANAATPLQKSDVDLTGNPSQLAATDEATVRANYNVIFEVDGIDGATTNDGRIALEDVAFIDTGSSPANGLFAGKGRLLEADRVAVHGFLNGFITQSSGQILGSDMSATDCDDGFEAGTNGLIACTGFMISSAFSEAFFVHSSGSVRGGSGTYGRAANGINISESGSFFGPGCAIDATSIGVVAQYGCYCGIVGSTIHCTGSIGAYAIGGSMIYVNSANFTGSPTYCLRSRHGSFIEAASCTFAGAGAYIAHAEFFSGIVLQASTVLSSPAVTFRATVQSVIWRSSVTGSGLTNSPTLNTVGNSNSTVAG